jgi:hypothetical protein
LKINQSQLSQYKKQIQEEESEPMTGKTKMKQMSKSNSQNITSKDPTIQLSPKILSA